MTDPTLFSNPSDSTEKIASPSEASTTLLEPPEPPLPPASPGHLQLWMHRISVFLFVLVSAVAGVLLIILPWTTYWTSNELLIAYPGLLKVVDHPFFRGVCSGLGLLDIWIGFWEALHYHEPA